MPTDQMDVEASVDTPDFGLSSQNLLLSVCRNAFAQLTGRNLISLGRLVVASTVVRVYGKELFGQYSLLITLLTIAEWLLDFGTSDVFVREICQSPRDGSRFLRILTSLKIFQILGGAAIFISLLYAMKYPPEVIRAGLAASTSLVCFGGVLIYHTIFKATLTIEREMAAELFSVIAMIFMVRYATHHGGGLSSLFFCYAASRATFLVFCVIFGHRRFHLSVARVGLSDVAWGFRSSAAIGTIGLVVVVYEALDVLLLFRLMNPASVGYYSGAQRFISPMVVALAAIGGTIYPVAASYWPVDKTRFENSCQRALDAVFLLAGVPICAIIASREFLMRLLGPDLVAGASILSVLAFVLFVKAITNTLGPILYVIRAQNYALWLVVFAVAMKATLIIALATRFGYVGAAISAVITDSTTAAATIYLLHRHSGFQAKWSVAVKVVLATLAAAYISRSLFFLTGPVAAVAAILMFTGMVLLTRAVRISELRALLKWKTV